eukprot:4450359-Pleurochrysis_carterae.AAC.3
MSTSRRCKCSVPLTQTTHEDESESNSPSASSSEAALTSATRACGLMPYTGGVLSSTETSSAHGSKALARTYESAQSTDQ